MIYVILGIILAGLLFAKFLTWRENQGIRDANEYAQRHRIDHRELQPWELLR